MSKKVNDILAELRRRLAALYGDRLVRIVLFGSQARGDAGADSDIDVMLVLTDPVQLDVELKRVTPITAALSLEHNVVISTIYMSARRYSNEQSPLLNSARREGVVV
jgi:predicted nucleotidyltransferase